MVSLVGAVLVVNAYFPTRVEPLTVASFAFGWLPGELPLQLVVIEMACTVWFVTEGALSDWTGWVGLGVALVSWMGLVGLAVSAHRDGRRVSEALAGASGGPLGGGEADPAPRWNRWWRIALGVPVGRGGVRRIRNVDYWGDGNYRHKCDILVPRDGTPERAPVLVYIHGGAWMIGDKREQGRPMMGELVRRGWVCVAVNYRLSPRATWPAHVVDCKRALAWVREHIAEYGGDPSFVAVSGGSAGGHLAALVALTPGDSAFQPGFEDADTGVDACVPFYGVYDMTGEQSGSGKYGPGLVELLEERVFKVAIADDREVFEQASPTFRVVPSAPPIFVLHGGNDTLVPVEVARVFVDRLRAVSEAPVAYAELPLAQHAFDVLASIRSRHTTMASVAFLEGIRARVAP